MIWRTLSISDISKPDVSLLKELYSNQRARVWTDTESDEIKIGTGSKQRDPWSSLKLKSVLPVALEDDLKTWREKGMGIKVRDAQSHCISNWRFADEVLSLFSSKNQLRKMMSDFKRSTSKTGLQIHPEKTNILSNQKQKQKQRGAHIDNIQVKNLPPNGKAKYLGQTFTFEKQETVEIKTRIRFAWSYFAKHRQ